MVRELTSNCELMGKGCRSSKNALPTILRAWSMLERRIGSVVQLAGGRFRETESVRHRW